MKSCLLWYPGASISTCDVAAGLQYGLEQHGVKVIAYNAEVEIEISGAALDYLWQSRGRPSDLVPSEADKIYRSGKAVVADAARARREHGVEWVIVVSGMYQHPDFLVLLRDCGFKVAMVFTESPYDTEHELKIAPIVNAVFTNERTCLEAFRSVNQNSAYLPHAWHPGVHKVMAQAQMEDEVPSHDVVFVGTYFQERVEFLSAIDWSEIDLALYGGTDEIDLRTKAGRRLKPFIKGSYLPNQRTAALYRSAKVGLNFHRTSKGFGPKQPRIEGAESLNPRCYELAATGCYFVSDRRAEADDVFAGHLETFTTSQECEALIRTALTDRAHRSGRALDCHMAVQPHNWANRAAIVVQSLDEIDGRRERAA